MDTETKKRLAKWLLGAGCLAAFGGFVAWQIENKRTEDRQHDADVAAMANAMDQATDSGGEVTDVLGIQGEKVEPNRTVSIVLFSIGGFGALSGVILLSGAEEGGPPIVLPPGPSFQPPPPPNERRDIAGQLAELVRMKEEGHIDHGELRRRSDVSCMGGSPSLGPISAPRSELHLGSAIGGTGERAAQGGATR